MVSISSTLTLSGGSAHQTLLLSPGKCVGTGDARQPDCRTSSSLSSTRGIQLLLVLHRQSLRRFMHKHLLTGMDVLCMSLPLHHSTLHNLNVHRHMLHWNIDLNVVRLGQLRLVRVCIHDPCNALRRCLLHRAVPSRAPVRQYRKLGGYVPPGIVVPELCL